MAQPVEWDAYERISDDAEGTGDAVGRQHDDTEAAVKARGGVVAVHHTENNTSAYKKRQVSVTDQYGNTYNAWRVMRPVWAAALQRIRTGEAQRLMVYDLDRLARDPRDLEDAIEVVVHYGAEIRSATASDVDLTTEHGILTARLMVMIANKASADTARRVRRQKQERASQGIPHKGRHRLYGYTGRVKQPDGTWIGTDWEVIPHEAEFIKEAFARRANGESTTAIANDMTKRGAVTVGGKPWRSGTLSETLKKTVYYGKVSFKGEVIADSNYEALVDEDTWLAAQANLANDSAGTNTRRYLLSGILRCGYCLSPMKGNPSNKMYRCSTTYGGCGRLSVRIAQADRWIVFAALDWAKASRSTSTVKKRDYKAEEASLRAERSKWQDAYQEGLYTLQEAQGPIRELDAQIKAVAKDAAKNVPRMNAVTKRLMDYQKMNLAQKRAFISEQITAVAVGPALSRGNQPFNPARFEVTYVDGSIVTLSGEVDPEDV